MSVVLWMIVTTLCFSVLKVEFIYKLFCDTIILTSVSFPSLRDICCKKLLVLLLVVKEVLIFYMLDKIEVAPMEYCLHFWV